MVETADLLEAWEGAPDGTRCCPVAVLFVAPLLADAGACRTGVNDDIAELGRSGSLRAALRWAAMVSFRVDRAF